MTRLTVTPGLAGFGEAAFATLYETVGVEGIKQLREIVETKNLEGLEQIAAVYPECKPLQKILASWGEWIDQWRLARLHPELCWKPRARKLVKPVIHKRVPNAQRVFDLLKEVGAQDLWKKRYSKMVHGVLAVDNNVWGKVKETIYDEIIKGDLVSFDYESTDKKSD